MESRQIKIKNTKLFLSGILFLAFILFFAAGTARADLTISWTTPSNSTTSNPNPSGGTWITTSGYIDALFVANGADYTWSGTTTIPNPTHSPKGTVILRLSYDWFDKSGTAHHVANALYNRYNYTSAGGDISIPLAGGVSIATCGNHAEAYIYIDYQIFPIPPGLCPTGSVVSDGICVKATAGTPTIITPVSNCPSGSITSDGICIKATIVVKPTPAVTCSATPNPSPTNGNVNFTSTITNADIACIGNSCTYSWTNSFTTGDTSSNTCKTGAGGSTANNCSAAFLSAGTKTATVTVTNVNGSTSANCPVTVVPPPAVTCSAAPNPSPINGAVNFTSTVSNAATACSVTACNYVWTNDCAGTLSTCSNSYETSGPKTATVTVTNIAGSVSADCPVTIVAPPAGITCSASPNPTPLGTAATFSSAVTNNAAACPGTACTYSWAGVPSDWLLLYANPNTCKAGGSTAASCSVKFLSVGVKTAKVTVTNIAGSATSANCSTTSFVDCQSGFLSDGICVKATTGSPVIITPAGSCPSGSVASDGICVKATTGSPVIITPAGSCPSGSVASDGICVNATTISSALTCSASPVNPQTNQSVAFSLAGFTCPPSQTCGYSWTNTWSGTDASSNTCKAGSGGSTTNNCSATFLSTGTKTARITATTSASGNFGPIDCPVTVANPPPQITQFDPTSQGYCGYGSGAGGVFFAWTYLGSPETRFQFQVEDKATVDADGGAFNSPEISSDVSGTNALGNSQTASVVINPASNSNQLAYNTTYYWRVRVYDNTAPTPLDSGWVIAVPFTTATHAYPYSSFVPSPASAPLISGHADIDFNDASQCYTTGGAAPYGCSTGASNTYFWNFGNGKTGNTKGSTSNSYTAANTNPGYTATLKVCDELNDCCTSTNTVRIGTPPNIPQWKEVSPF